jgi:CubicO group peptidase (beta-lactamase class C family)
MPVSFEGMAEALAAARAVPLAARPGERAAYGSFDFTVLAAVLEKVGQAPYESLLRERILGPLGLEDAAFDHARLSPDLGVRSWDVQPGRATTYRPEGGVTRAYAFHYPPYAYAAGGLFASIRDLAAVLQTVDRRLLLSPSAHEQMWTACPLEGDGRGAFAVGWTVGTIAGRRAVGHSGGPALSDLLYFPDDRLGVVVLSNQGKLFPNLAQGVARLLLPAPTFAEPELADAFPSLTANTKAALVSLATDRPLLDHFGGVAREAVEGADGWFALQLSSFPPLGRLVLREDAPAEGGRVRSYRAWHGHASVRWRIVTDAEGRIADLDLADE